MSGNDKMSSRRAPPAENCIRRVMREMVLDEPSLATIKDAFADYRFCRKLWGLSRPKKRDRHAEV